MSQPGAPTAPWAAVGGPPLLSFLLALAGSTRAWLLRSPRRAGGQGRDHAGRRSPLAAASALVLAGNLAVDPPSGTTPTATIATVQGDVPHARNLPDQLRATTVTENHAPRPSRSPGRSRLAAARTRPGDLAGELNRHRSRGCRRLSTRTIAAAVNAIARPVLVGAVLDHPLRNAGQLWLPGHGPAQLYVKRQLVPFGEVIPFRGLLSHSHLAA